MKRLALMFVLLLALAAPAFAINGVGDVSAYADDQGNGCNITNPGAGFLNVYLIHKFLPGEESLSSRFKVEMPAGLLPLAFNTTFVTVGTLGQDLSVGYGVCQQTQVVIGTIITQVTGPSPTCSYISMLPSDILTDLQATDCTAAEKIMGGGQAIVNPDAGCQCNIATEATSWGKVKALYR